MYCLNIDKTEFAGFAVSGMKVTVEAHLYSCWRFIESTSLRRFPGPLPSHDETILGMIPPLSFQPKQAFYDGDDMLLADFYFSRSLRIRTSQIPESWP